METRIQFRINEETKRQGRTLSDACRALNKQLIA